MNILQKFNASVKDFCSHQLWWTKGVFHDCRTKWMLDFFFKCYWAHRNREHLKSLFSPKATNLYLETKPDSQDDKNNMGHGANGPGAKWETKRGSHGQLTANAGTSPIKSKVSQLRLSEFPQRKSSQGRAHNWESTSTGGDNPLWGRQQKKQAINLDP